MLETQSERDAATGRLSATQVECIGDEVRLAEQVEYAGDEIRLAEELRAARLRVVQAADRERRRLEQDLHDGAQQRLVEIQIRLAAARRLAARDDLADELTAIEEAVEAALDDLRTLARGIHPATLRDHGPAAALRALAQRSPIAIRIVDEGVGRASPAVEAAIYFCAREAVQNATKHVGPTAAVTATLARRGSTIQLTISDNGNGITPQAATTGIGIRSMHDRLEAVGGELHIFSAPGEGTCIHGTIPAEVPQPRACSSSSRRSAAATSRRVRSSTSTDTEMLSIPARTSSSAYSGCTDGA